MTTRTTSSKQTHLHLEKYVPGLLLWLSNKLAGSASQVYRRQFDINIVEWRMGGISYVAVSDAEAAQLLAFARLVQAAG